MATKKAAPKKVLVKKVTKKRAPKKAPTKTMNKKAAPKTASPRSKPIPTQVAQWLARELCDSGVTELAHWLLETDPDVAVHAVLQTLARRFKKKEAKILGRVKNAERDVKLAEGILAECKDDVEKVRKLKEYLK